MTTSSQPKTQSQNGPSGQKIIHEALKDLGLELDQYDEARPRKDLTPEQKAALHRFMERTRQK